MPRPFLPLLHAVVAVLGALLLYRSATPFTWNGVELGSANWGWVAQIVVVVGVVVGTIEGALVAVGHRVVAGAVFVVVSVAALVACGIPLLRFGDTDEVVHGSGDLFWALLLWGTYQAVATAVAIATAVTAAAITSRRASTGDVRESGSEPASGNDAH